MILDGEMLVWDPISGRNLPFGALKTAALGTSIHPSYKPKAEHLQINQRRSIILDHAVRILTSSMT